MGISYLALALALAVALALALAVALALVLASSQTLCFSSGSGVGSGLVFSGFSSSLPCLPPSFSSCLTVFYQVDILLMGLSFLCNLKPFLNIFLKFLF